jgi:hypothetical protein
MSVALRIDGGRELDDAVGDLIREARRFQRRVSTAAGKAVKGSYAPTLIGLAPTFMPSGYAPVLVADLKVAVTVRFAGSSPGVGVKVSAPTGGPSGRHVDALEEGRLRHPFFGDTKRWYLQRIAPGFGSIPLKAIRPQIVREIDQELGAIVRDVERG